MKIDRSKVRREKVWGARGGWRLQRQKIGEHVYDGSRIVGCVATPLGMVYVHSEYNSRESYTLYRFVHRGHEYRYSEEVFHSERALAGAAHQFAQYVVKYEVEP